MKSNLAVFSTLAQIALAAKGEQFTCATVRSNAADPYLLQGAKKSNPMQVKVNVPEGVKGLKAGTLEVFCTSSGTIGLAGNEELFEALKDAPKVDSRAGNGKGFVFPVIEVVGTETSAW